MRRLASGSAVPMHSESARFLVVRHQEHWDRELLVVIANSHPLDGFINCPRLFWRRFGRKVVTIDKFEPRSCGVEIPHSIKDFLVAALFNRVTRQCLEPDVNYAGDVRWQ